MLNIGSLNIVLVQPSVEDFYFTPHRSSALGLRSLAAVWGKRGHNCLILNFSMLKPLKKNIPLPDGLEYLYPFLKNTQNEVKGTSYFNKYNRFGPGQKSCAEQIKALGPQVIAVTCFAWSYAEATVELLKLLKNMWSQSENPPLIVAGGPGVTVFPNYFLPFADLVITGEGENAIKFIENRIEQNNRLEKGEIVSPSPPVEIPFVWNISLTRKKLITVTTMLTRGCPKMCSFCANHLIFGKSLRKIDLQKVYSGLDLMVESIQKEYKKYGVIDKYFHINFEDDNILFLKSYFLKVLNYINDKCVQNKINFSFSAENGMDYLLLNKKLLDEFKSLKIAQLNISMATLNQDQLIGEKREGSLIKLESVIEFCNKINIPVICYFICGLKNDTPERIIEIIAYLHRSKTSIGISLYYPVPGLTDWQDRDLFKKLPPRLCCGSSAYPWNNNLNTRELVTAFRLARTSNYINNSADDIMLLKKIRNILLEDKTMVKSMVELFFAKLYCN
jgi:anaerobic magnesium-protoporphyrin IX monomethyl ester cyclase